MFADVPARRPPSDWSSPGYGVQDFSAFPQNFELFVAAYPSGTFMVIAMMAYLMTTCDYVLNELGVRSGCQTGNEKGAMNIVSFKCLEYPLRSYNSKLSSTERGRVFSAHP
tara:strand:+ start:171 stop:503 length:333 start_codon:yes stop_codon:yes gene_type:complete